MQAPKLNREAKEELDRVRRNSLHSANRKIDQRTEEVIGYWSQLGRDAISARIRELDREWDVERFLELTASTFALTGVLTGLKRGRATLVFSAIVLAFLFEHAVQGWCPPLPLFRLLGVRTRKEIDREKYALKALRADSSRA